MATPPPLEQSVVDTDQRLTGLLLKSETVLHQDTPSPEKATPTE
jgi:hypothetical protein